MTLFILSHSVTLFILEHLITFFILGHSVTLFILDHSINLINLNYVCLHSLILITRTQEQKGYVYCWNHGIYISLRNASKQYKII